MKLFRKNQLYFRPQSTINKLLFLFVVVFIMSFFITGCSGPPPKISPMPAIDISKNTSLVITKSPEADTTKLPVKIELIATSPMDAPINQGSNIENGGYALFLDDVVNYVDGGLNRINKNSSHIKQVSEKNDMLFLNKIDNLLYYVSADDYNVYYLDITKDDEPIKIGLYGACFLMVLGDYIYFQLAVGHEADFYIYRADKDGSNPENLGIKASSFSSDGQNIYFANLDDDYKLYVYIMSQGIIEQLSNNNAHQLNIMGDYLYYINRTTEKITKLNVKTLESVVLYEEKCSYLNINGNILIFSHSITGGIFSMHKDGSDIKQILEYNDINGLISAGDYVFFESYQNTLNEKTFWINLKSEELSEALPVTTLSLIANYDAEKKIIVTDYIEYLTGDEAIKTYIKDNSVSERKAKQALEVTSGVYIRNLYQKYQEYKILDLTNIVLLIKQDGSFDTNGYNVDCITFSEIYNANEELVKSSIFSVTGFDGELVSLIQFDEP